jgi:hypothetical protein
MRPWKVLGLAALAVGIVSVPVGAAERLLTNRLGVTGQKTLAPQTAMSEAGVTWAFTPRVRLHLSYERTGYAPTMPFDHDDGIMTGIKIGF